MAAMVTATDREALVRQMGKPPSGVVAIAARCSSGHPCVVTCHPLRHIGAGVDPFPTLYWLTCPDLSRQLAHLERDGVMNVIEQELAHDAAMREALEKDHHRYEQTRRQLIDDDVEYEQWFDGRGIAGMRNRAAVKCLHAHYAQHLVDGNTIGKWIDKHYPLKPCRSTDA
jgi:hypothetical protein